MSGRGPAARRPRSSCRRSARNVARLLIRYGVPTSRVTSKGFGDTQPSGDERRVEITVR